MREELAEPVEDLVKVAQNIRPSHLGDVVPDDKAHSSSYILFINKNRFGMYYLYLIRAFKSI
jgi:hypothetical protein